MAVLDKMYLQPGTAEAQLGENGRTFTEVWKGPWSQIKDVASTGKVFGTTLLPGGKRPAFNNGYWDKSAGTPAPMSASLPWIISGIEIQQTIGDHGILTITYKSGDGDESDPDSGEYPEYDEDDPCKLIESATSWQLSWEAFKRSVLDYSSDPTAISLYKNFPTGVPYQYYVAGSMHGAKASITEADDGKERKIAEYFKKGVSPQFHYPVVTLHEEYTLPSGVQIPFRIGKDLDIIQKLPDNCPFKDGLEKQEDSGSSSGGGNSGSTSGSSNNEGEEREQIEWEWVLVADVGSISSEQKGVQVLRKIEGQTTPEYKLMKKYTRERKWQGAVKWDQNFYGENAWQPFDPPDPEQQSN